MTDSRLALRNGLAAAAPPIPTVPATPKPVVGFHGAVTEFKRRLIEASLAQTGGNRTRAAKALGLQRTYLLRLMREFQIHIPPSSVPPRRSEISSNGLSSPTFPSQTH
jgi:DNA-binding NtrC family response regulator